MNAINGYLRVTYENILYAEVIFSEFKTDETVFFSDCKQSFQFGVLAHKKGFIEKPHSHFNSPKKINDLQQMFVIQRGKIKVNFHDKENKIFKSIILNKGDAINLVDGIHSLEVLETMQCISVKQGPFLGSEKDKIEIK